MLLKDFELTEMGGGTTSCHGGTASPGPPRRSDGTVSSQCHNSLVFPARQIANNLSPMAKNFELFFLALRIISIERTPNNLAFALQFFCAYFVHVLRCSKQVFRTEI